MQKFKKNMFLCSAAYVKIFLQTMYSSSFHQNHFSNNFLFHWLGSAFRDTDYTLLNPLFFNDSIFFYKIHALQLS